MGYIKLNLPAVIFLWPVALATGFIFPGCCPNVSKPAVASTQAVPQAPLGYYYKLKIRPVSAGPAWDIGDPKQIADWALTRTDSHSIFDAIRALLDKVIEGADEDFVEELQAQEGLSRINNKLCDGWPGLDKESINTDPDGQVVIVPLDGPKQSYIKSMFRALYHGVGGLCYDRPHNSNLNLFFESLRPPASAPDRLRLWEEGERARKMDLSELKK